MRICVYFVCKYICQTYTYESQMYFYLNMYVYARTCSDVFMFDDMCICILNLCTNVFIFEYVYMHMSNICKNIIIFVCNVHLRIIYIYTNV